MIIRRRLTFWGHRLWRRATDGTGYISGTSPVYQSGQVICCKLLRVTPLPSTLSSDWQLTATKKLLFLTRGKSGPRRAVVRGEGYGFKRTRNYDKKITSVLSQFFSL